MNNHPQDQFKNLLLEKMETFTRQEREFIRRMMERRHVTRNINTEFDEQLTVGQRLADNVAKFGGSWTFITIFALILLAWVILNSVILARFNDAFDPYPYILLNLFLSMLAAIQAPIIMMSQNRQAAKDRLDAAHDYEVNLKAEMEIETLHQKLDELRDKQWADLVEMQQEQIRLLTRLLEEKG
ncbi:MAG TPA: DUF1003 domain-containing protein [Anaerolineales bacterium]|nr:DUF1003 domain-containing protein [Anaerolineales bacterium]HNB35917.1 DUF1003 domain-containing protein [Anaerolineales bacterium]